ncbi:MAG: ribonuclease HI [Atopobiaceae bacterium]|jgi:ribonuclease HI|nr:ribonuclease HI [Atopobiaceae bacterium]MCI1389434.1 ribonuclease HI [Atopobiaceae bacterium]MCI1432285.1 ribonuclease HI [Atopobiaceae bacterium]MCI1470743.1 ribonuclease HI [Atopobiaceae bacterium]
MAVPATARVTVYADGSSKGNPGPGGYGAVLLFVDAAGVEHRKELSAGYALTTNNRMELMAPIAALEALTRPCQVELHSDSQYLVNAFTKGWVARWQRTGWRTAGKKPVKNRDLWERLLAAVAPHEVSWTWVKGHAGDDLNETCDRLAVSAASRDASELAEDAGFLAQKREGLL